MRRADIMLIGAVIVLVALGLLAGRGDHGSADTTHGDPAEPAPHRSRAAETAGGEAPVAAADPELRHEFGTPPDARHVPERAVDTDEPPRLALEPEAEDRPLPTLYEVAEGVYMLFGNIAEVDESNRGFNGNAGFVVTDAGVIAIDSLGSPELGRRMIATIRSVTDKPIKYLILTHSHPDHSYGAVAFRRLGGVTVVGHEGTLDYIHSERIDGSAEYRRGFIAEDMQGFEGVEPDVLIGGERFSKRSIHLGDRRLEVYNVGQHHSAGDLVVRQVEARILWIGDLAFNGRVTFMADGHSKQILEGQRWLMESFGERARLMVPGHGSAQTPPFPMVERTRRYVTGLRRKMARAVEQGWGLQKAVERSHMPAWEEVRLYGLNHRPNANFVYREMEMALF